MAHQVVESGAGVSGQVISPPKITTFYSLRFRDFRFMWQGQIGASASQWMEQFARPFLMLALTDSPFLVGLVAATRMIPMLLVGLWAGVIADRLNKRRILLACQTITFGSHVITAGLLFTDVIAPWHVFLGTFVTGCAQAFNQPARQSLIPRLVPRECMANALALNAAAFNTMRVGGPAIGGAILAATTFGHIYAAQSLVYVWVLWSTFQIRLESPEAPREQTSMFSELKEGFGLLRQDRIIFYIMVLSLSLFVFGMPFQAVFIPLIAVESLDMSASTAALLVSLVGAGALIGALVIATIGDSVRRRGLLMIGMVITFCLALFLFAKGGSIATAAPALLILGAMQTSFMSLNNAFVLGRTPQELHGRVMSLFSLDRGLVPLGATLGGFLAEWLGATNGLTVMASICLFNTLLVVMLVPSLRKMT